MMTTMSAALSGRCCTAAACFLRINIITSAGYTVTLPLADNSSTIQLPTDYF